VRMCVCVFMVIWRVDLFVFTHIKLNISFKNSFYCLDKYNLVFYVKMKRKQRIVWRFIRMRAGLVATIRDCEQTVSLGANLVTCLRKCQVVINTNNNLVISAWHAIFVGIPHIRCCHSPLLSVTIATDIVDGLHPVGLGASGHPSWRKDRTPLLSTTQPAALLGVGEVDDHVILGRKEQLARRLGILLAQTLVSTEVVGLALPVVHPPASVGEVVEPRPLVGAQGFRTQDLDLIKLHGEGIR